MRFSTKFTNFWFIFEILSENFQNFLSISKVFASFWKFSRYFWYLRPFKKFSYVLEILGVFQEFLVHFRNSTFWNEYFLFLRSSVSNSPVSNSSPPSSSSSPCSLSPRLDRQSSSLVKLLTADTNSNYDGGGGDKDGELAFIGNRLGTKRNANGQISRRYQNINGGVGTEENVKGRQRCPTLAANPNRWTNRNQPTNLYSKSRSDTNYYGDGRKYRVNNNGGLQNAIGNLAKGKNFFVTHLASSILIAKKE